MKNRWDDIEAGRRSGNPFELCVYMTRLLGCEPDLVLHGGGNTSVKSQITNIFGETQEIIYIKGSGLDMASIDHNGFAPVRLRVLRQMAALDHLTDQDMIRIQRSAMIEPTAPNPSLEAILHAIVPFQYVSHTHADAVVTLTNNARCHEILKSIYGSKILRIPYCQPGFELCKKIHRMTREIDWSKIRGILVEHHGIFTFADMAADSYHQMIDLVTMAEAYLEGQGAVKLAKQAPGRENLILRAKIRRAVSDARGAAMIAIMDKSPEACGFSGLPDIIDVARRGCLTPDHIIRTKSAPMLIDSDPGDDVKRFVKTYTSYYERHNNGRYSRLDPAPRWAVWPEHGIISFGRNMDAARTVADIAAHTARAIQWGETIGGWKPVSEEHLFELEYWDLQQAKLSQTKNDPEFQGKIVFITGAANGIGLTCAMEFHHRGAVVAGVDIDPTVMTKFNRPGMLGLVCDVSNDSALKKAVDETVRMFGGLDILVPNAGCFPDSRPIETMEPSLWNQCLAINLTSQQRLLQFCIPYLKIGIDSAVILIASKNVPAPGPGAAAYSVSKAGATQLARVAALELAPFGVRVNMVHPDAIFDTGLWTEEVIQNRARCYGLTVEEYRTKNLLRTELNSQNVADLVCALAGKPFMKTTGAQIPIDGGNERVI